MCIAHKCHSMASFFNKINQDSIYSCIFMFSINLEVTITFLHFLAIWLVDAARLSGGSLWLPSDYNIFQTKVLGMLGTTVCDKEQKNTKIMKRTSLRTFRVKFVTCNVFAFYKNFTPWCEYEPVITTPSVTGY